MNVLLAEANVPYDQLFDLDDINDDFRQTDIALIVGANDIVNPAAKTNPQSPIYGMPVFNVEQSRTVMVLKRGLGSGFSGIENDLFVQPNTVMVLGDARKTLQSGRERTRRVICSPRLAALAPPPAAFPLASQVCSRASARNAAMLSILATNSTALYAACASFAAWAAAPRATAGFDSAEADGTKRGTMSNSIPPEA